MSVTLRTSRSTRRRRERRVVAALVAGVVVMAALSLSIGAYSLGLPELIRTLLGHGTRSDTFIVVGLRLPRLVLAVLAGILFALSGALFQSILRNPLASPDIIGVTGGASAGAVFGMLVLGAGAVATSALALTGGLLVAILIFALAGRGTAIGYRFVLIGVAVAFMVQGVIGFLLTRADLRDAQDALVWLVGGVGGSQWSEIAVLFGCLLLAVPVLWLITGRLRALQLGDETATSLGVKAGGTRIAGLSIAVVLAAVATAAVGPLAFVAFVSAPIARRATGSGGLVFLPTALVGILVTVVADFAAQHLLPGARQLPAGVITGAIGAPYLLWLLAAANREKGAHFARTHRRTA